MKPVAPSCETLYGRLCQYRTPHDIRVDNAKAAANLAKHGVAFELAEEVWDDPAHIIVFDRHENNEERWHAIGLVRAVLILTVVHTYPNVDDDQEDEERVRIVSARKATRDERKRYEAQDD